MPSYPLLSTLFIVVIGLGLFVYTLNFVRVIEQRYPAHGEVIDVDGVDLHYIKKGSGPPIVLLHGASSSLRDFPGDLIDDLAEDFTVFAFDRHAV